MLRGLIFLLLISGITLADNRIGDILKSEYRKHNMSQKFDYHANAVIRDYKEDTSYFDKLLANNGWNAADQAEEIANKVFALYTNDFDNVLNNTLKDDTLIREIKKNYDEYITQSSTIVLSELDEDFSNKFLNIYNSDTLKAMLKDDINKNISETKQEILDSVKNNVVDGQLTATEAIVGAVVVQVIFNVGKIIVKRIGIQVAQRLASRVIAIIPILGWVLAAGMTAYDAATVNDLYDDMGKEIKLGFHSNEQLILDETTKILSDINNISISYQEGIAIIASDYIMKAKVPYVATRDNKNIRDKILNGDNYLFLQILDVFYRIPSEYYDYLVSIYLDLPSEEKKIFTDNINKLDDIYIFENIMYIEKTTIFKVNVNDFFTIAELLDRLQDTNEADYFYNFTKEVSGGKVDTKLLFSLFEPYQILKDNNYLKLKYAKLDDTNKKKLLDYIEEEKIKFDNIEYFERNYNFQILASNFIKMAELLNNFKSNNDIKSFYTFNQQVSNNTVMIQSLFDLYEPYQILKKSEYLMKKYASLEQKDREKLLEVVEVGKTDFSKIGYFEAKYRVQIPSNEFVSMAILFNRFKTDSDIDKYIKNYQYNFGEIVLLDFKSYLEADSVGKYLMVSKEFIVKHKYLLITLLIMIAFIIYFYRRKVLEKTNQKNEGILALSYSPEDKIITEKIDQNIEKEK